MMRNPIKAILSLAVVLTASPVRAQDIRVEIETNRSDANVYADSLWLGKASAELFLIPDGTKEISLVPAAADAWAIPAIIRSVPIDWIRTDTIRLVMTFPYYYGLESIPSNASVYLSDGVRRTLLGETPVVYSTEDPQSGEFVFDRAGFLTRRIRPGSALWNRHLVALEPVGSESASEVSLNVGSKRRRWIDYVAMGTAVTAGVLAIHFKTKANNRYAKYEQTGNPELRGAIHRLDVLSGVSLGAMQLGLGVFAVRLIF
ncbi:MAG: hypothetical protein IIA50_04245 [Bacteroidetes bacterium]|nr:hypothetical protein [Bacteroidota bacterium]